VTRLAGLARSAAVALAAGACVAAAPVGVVQKGVVFTDYPPQASVAELMRRLLSPLQVAKQLDENARSGLGAPPAQAFDPAGESFALYVPANKPPAGYGLVVYVPPWDDAEIPPRYTPVLDQLGVIMVSAAHSGNAQDTANRRVPLAVLAAANVATLYPVDPSRVFIAGLSGGGQVAMRIALAYPDVFYGAILNSGSNVLGDADDAAPPRDLFEQLQTGSRLIYVTGENDETNIDIDAASRASLRDLCMFNIATQTVPQMGHDLAPPLSFALALKTLMTPINTDAARLAACRAKVDGAIDARLAAVQAQLAAGRRDAALSALADIDRRYGGLAAPRSTDLAK
jgi:pimeloyl-ACP methyl ester carboxylesterase